MQPERDIRRHREVRKEGVVLEHHADAALFRRHHDAGSGHDATRKADLAGLNALEARYAAQHCGLAAAARPEKAADRTAGERKAQGGYDFVLAIRMAQVFDFEKHGLIIVIILIIVKIAPP